MTPHTTSACRIALVSLCLALAPALHAETLVQYNFTGGSPASPSLSASVTGTNVVTQSFATGGGVDLDRSTVNSSGGTGNSAYAKPSTVDASSGGPDWVGFTISSSAGNVLYLSELSFDYAYSYNTAPRPATPVSFNVHFSVDNWTTSTSIGNFSQSTPAVATSITWENASIGLLASSLQGVESVSFRIFLDDGANTNDASYIRIDAVTLSGVSTAAVPEPSSYALLVGLSGLGVTTLRRRRTRVV